jgi:hypothetical protein
MVRFGSGSLLFGFLCDIKFIYENDIVLTYQRVASYIIILHLFFVVLFPAMEDPVITFAFT